MEDELSFDALLRNGAFTERAMALGHDKLRKLVENSELQSRIRPKQFVQWVGILCDICNNLASPGKAHLADLGFFWLVLHELLTSGLDYVNKGLLLLEFVNADRLRPEYKAVFERDRMVKTILDRMKAEFSKDELIYIEYKRNCSAHIFQDGYAFSLSRAGQLRTEYGGMEISDIMSLVKIEIEKHGNENKASAAYSNRIHALVAELLLLL